MEENLSLRLSADDKDFLRKLFAKQSVSTSELLHSIIGGERGIRHIDNQLPKDILQQLFNYYYELSLEPDYSEYQECMNDIRYYICEQIVQQLVDDDMLIFIAAVLRGNARITFC